MALAIGIHPGDKIYVGNTPIEVVEVHGYTHAVIRVKGTTVKVDDTKAVEIFPEVLVSCGKPSMHRTDKQSSLVKEAIAEWDSRREKLRTGAMSQREYSSLPRVEMPPALLPRLVFDAPPSVTILRETLYRRGLPKRYAAQAA